MAQTSLPLSNSTTKICASADCGKRVHARGFCNSHYVKLLTAGAFEPIRRKICIAPDCNLFVSGHGYCKTHYARWAKNGHIELQYRPNDVERFWAKVVKGGEDDCWNWQGAKCEGYGIAHFAGKDQRANRISFALHHGHEAINFVLHTCDNPSCVNPKHLYDGTAKQNTQDALARNRHNPPKGERNGKSKLTESQAIEILRRSRNGETWLAISKDYGVTEGCIYQLCTGLRWKHLFTPKEIDQAIGKK